MGSACWLPALPCPQFGEKEGAGSAGVVTALPSGKELVQEERRGAWAAGCGRGSEGGSHPVREEETLQASKFPGKLERGPEREDHSGSSLAGLGSPRDVFHSDTASEPL